MEQKLGHQQLNHHIHHHSDRRYSLTNQSFHPFADQQPKFIESDALDLKCNAFRYALRDAFN